MRVKIIVLGNFLKQQVKGWSLFQPEFLPSHYVFCLRCFVREQGGNGLKAVFVFFIFFFCLQVVEEKRVVCKSTVEVRTGGYNKNLFPLLLPCATKVTFISQGFGIRGIKKLEVAIVLELRPGENSRGYGQNTRATSSFLMPLVSVEKNSTLLQVGSGII